MSQAAAKIAEQSLKTRYQQLKAQKPDLRARNAAEELGVSEGELLACKVGDGVIRLKDDAQGILSEILSLGDVMALTRNEAAVHERHGVYDNVSFSQHGPMKMGLAVNPDIDLRLFMDHWKFCFAAAEESHGKIRKSIQFFDKSGLALHKIYLTSKSNEKAYDALVEKFTAAEQQDFIPVEPYVSTAKPNLADSDIDWAAFRKEWEGLKDTHDFYPLLRKFKVGRVQAHRKIGKDFAYEINNKGLRQTLELARDRECPIMVFVGNRGCLQIHSGPVKKLVEQGPWYNVLDPEFNLHVREDLIATSWVTKKPTVDGIVTAVECFDKDGEIILTLFGKRKPGIPELNEWCEIVAELAV